MEREKFHQLLDLVLDIAEKGKGEYGFPMVHFTVSNFPVHAEVYMKDSGFNAGSQRDGEYDFQIAGGESQRKYNTCIQHLEELKEKAEGFQNMKNAAYEAAE